MDRLPRPPESFFEGTLPHVRVYIEQLHALIDHLYGVIEKHEVRIADLEARLNKNSQNTSLPPSATHPQAKPAPMKPKPKSKLNRGGQPGHEKHERALIPVEECQAVVPCIPDACRKCGRELAGVDPEPLRHQMWELPPITPHVTEYQRHRLFCVCGCSTCGELPEGVPTGQAGPRQIAFSGLLMACFRQSKQRAAQFLSTILNQPASAAWMVLLQNRCAEAVKPAYDKIAEQLPTQAALNIHESPRKEGPAKAWVWTVVTSTFTFFTCRVSRGGEVLKSLLGEAYAGVIHCDRARMYWQFGQLQWCWAHLKRDFQAWIDDPCPTKKRLGRDLMRPTLELFALWKKVRDGTLNREQFLIDMQPIRAEIDALLLRGYWNALTRGVCRELWERREHLWTFLEVEGVEPTNNAAERALRHAVIWRKLSFGTQSASGSRFVERMLTVIETTRRQGTNAFEWLTDVLRAKLEGRPGPRLVTAIS